MKKLTLIFAILIGSVIMNNNVQAQHINVNINIGSQPAWGPTGYDYVDYYYLPDINAYYIVNSHNYVYLDGRNWVTARYLPYRYRNYDLYNMYKVVLVGGSRSPWTYNNRHYKEYGRYRNYRGQSVIRDTRDTRYTRSRNNSAPWYRESSPNRVTTNTRPATRTNVSTRPNTSSNRESNVRSTTRENSNRTSGQSSSSRSTSNSNSRTTNSSSRR